MHILELYILKRIFISFIFVMTAAIGIMWTVQILTRIDFLTTSKQTFLTTLHFSSLLIPSVIALVIPFALVIAITTVLSTMNQDSELTIISTSGLPQSIIWKPILSLAIIVSCVSFFTTNFIAPQARLHMRQMIANAHSDLINFFITEGTFQKLTNNLYLEIGERHPDGTIGRLFIADQRDPKIDLLYYAVKGAIVNNKNGNFLVLNDGEMKQLNHQNSSVSIIKFSSYTFNLNEFISDKGIPTIYPKDRPLSYLLNPTPDDPSYQLAPLKYKAELHRRLIEWFYPVVFTLVSVIIAGNAYSHRQMRIPATFSAITISLLIYWMEYFFIEKIKHNPAYIPLLYAVPIGMSMFLFGGLLFDYKTNIFVKYDNLIQTIFQKVISKFEYHKSQSSSDNIS
ncbi:LPS export ABC transporter permease LptF [Bartonella ancashensis]|uniref:Putative permease n=1 Tax=Bartonella ancashensis TaxID=1318743 RepID=A0A0M3T370_9HYPH|nr:LPS export ABC transporter permease LptF [Bartonella ancashensis]ALE03965.1 putative permease [Bartonella ancashensis]